jgi:excinuclease UvrABC ATPase subunit
VSWRKSWPGKWYGVRRFFAWLESKSYKMHIRVLLSKYRAYTPCTACDGARLKPDALPIRQALALRVLGNVYSRAECLEPKRAQEHYIQSRELSQLLGMRPLTAHCHFGLAKLYRQTKKREQAREHLTTATTMYREMGMQFWLEQAEAEMRGLT